MKLRYARVPLGYKTLSGSRLAAQRHWRRISHSAARADECAHLTVISHPQVTQGRALRTAFSIELFAARTQMNRFITHQESLVATIVHKRAHCRSVPPATQLGCSGRVGKVCAACGRRNSAPRRQHRVRATCRWRGATRAGTAAILLRRYACHGRESAPTAAW